MQGLEPHRYGEREDLWRFTHLHGPVGSPPVYWYVEYRFGPDGRYCQAMEVSRDDSDTECFSPMQTALYTQVYAPYEMLAVAAYIAYDVLFACWALIQMRRRGGRAAVLAGAGMVTGLARLCAVLVGTP